MEDFRQLFYISIDFVIVHSKWKLFSFLFLFSLTSCSFLGYMRLDGFEMALESVSRWLTQPKFLKLFKKQKKI